MSAVARMIADDFSILRLWRSGHDTKTIAEKLGTRECEIANALARIFDRARGQ
jgi:DNA-binding CsgD family transcriptional regulator